MHFELFYLVAWFNIFTTRAISSISGKLAECIAAVRHWTRNSSMLFVILKFEPLTLLSTLLIYVQKSAAAKVSWVILGMVLSFWVLSKVSLTKENISALHATILLLWRAKIIIIILLVQKFREVSIKRRLLISYNWRRLSLGSWEHIILCLML